MTYLSRCGRCGFERLRLLLLLLLLLLSSGEKRGKLVRLRGARQLAEESSSGRFELLLQLALRRCRSS